MFMFLIPISFVSNNFLVFMNPIPIVCTFSIFLLTIILSYKFFAEELDILKSFSVTIIDIIVEDMRKRTELTEAVPSLHLRKGKR